MVQPRLQNFVSPIVQILESKSDAVKANANSNDGTLKKANTNAEQSKELEGDQKGAAIDMDGLQVLALSLQEALVASVGAESYFSLYQTLVGKRQAAKNEKKTCFCCSDCHRSRTSSEAEATKS